MKRSSRLAMVALLLAMPLGALGNQAGALTTWRTFGSGSARGWGNLGAGVVDSSVVYLDSTTRQNPERLRLVVNGPRAGRANIRWHMFCGNSPTDIRESRFNSFNAQLPRIVDLSNRLGGVRNWRSCSVDAQVSYFRLGTVRLLLQARY
jgi:hypothetical protein